MKHIKLFILALALLNSQASHSWSFAPIKNFFSRTFFYFSYKKDKEMLTQLATKKCLEYYVELTTANKCLTNLQNYRNTITKNPQQYIQTAAAVISIDKSINQIDTQHAAKIEEMKKSAFFSEEQIKNLKTEPAKAEARVHNTHFAHNASQHVGSEDQAIYGTVESFKLKIPNIATSWYTQMKMTLAQNKSK